MNHLLQPREFLDGIEAFGDFINEPRRLKISNPSAFVFKSVFLKDGKAKGKICITTMLSQGLAQFSSVYLHKAQFCMKAQHNL